MTEMTYKKSFVKKTGIIPKSYSFVTQENELIKLMTCNYKYDKHIKNRMKIKGDEDPV